ncbi:hypothetical protein TNCV_3061721 [Trichonephila clavipes]|nr:hypothetical protein TNCV_3061721 [Trichonephila clavipes]
MTFWEYTSTDLATDEVHTLCDHARMDGDTCSNALDSMNTRLTTFLLDTGRFGVKLSRSQAWAESHKKPWSLWALSRGTWKEPRLLLAFS